MRSCGDMHRGGYTGYVSSCSECRKANGLKSVDALDAENRRLKAQLRKAKEGKRAPKR